MKWSAAIFQSLYESIENGQLDEKLFDELLPDLQNLNLNNEKLKNANSRAELERGEVTLANGDTYKVNQEFMIAAIMLSDELDLDEIVSCELILSGSNTITSENNGNLSLLNTGKVQFFLRRQFILQIVAFLTNCLHKNHPNYQTLISNDVLVSNILNSFSNIHDQLSEIKQSVNRAQILDNYSILSQQNVKFKRDFLLREYDTLSQILYGLVKNGTFMKRDYLIKLVNHTTEMQSNDFFIIYYLPSIFCAFGNLEGLPDADVKSIHSQFVQELKSDSMYENPTRVSLIYIFLSYFINWCKLKPSERANTMDFQAAVDEPMTKAVEFGALEQLLIFAADTSISEKDKSMDLFYNIRSLLERHIPRLVPIQLLDINPIDSPQGQLQIQAQNYQNQVIHQQNNQFSKIILSQQAEGFFLSTFHDVLRTTIADCAFLLTKIKDAEEDSLLSGEDLDLDDIALRADLERFFLTIYFFYASRPAYSKLFWQDKESNAYGFVEWSAKCNDSLMRSCFYLMISSLSYGTENALSVYHYFGANNNISWNVIAQCISDYILKITNLNLKVQQKQQKQDTEEVDSTAVALEDGLNEEAIIFISSLLTLIGSVAHDVEGEIRNSLSDLFTDILFEFAKLDTPLIGACLQTLSHLVPNLESKRTKFWYSLDALIFKGASLSSMSSSYRIAFTSALTNFSEVVGFLQLFGRLLSIETKEIGSDFMSFGKLAFPMKLGQGYRKAGIWPYFDYIFHEVFVHSNQLADASKATAIQLPILNIIEQALFSFDYRFIINSIPAQANFDKLVSTEDFFTYVQESPAPAVFNYLFTEKVYKCIFDIASIGVDNLAIDLGRGAEQLELITMAVKIICLVLEFQDPYVEEFASLLTKNRKSNYFMPKDFGLHGLRSFYDAVIFNLPMIAHLGLYVGLENYLLASHSLQILKMLSDRYTGDKSFTVKNKLLTIFDSVDESARIKDAFISQLERPIENMKSLVLKLEIMDFINENLSFTDHAPTVAHLLLGFQVSNVLSTGPNLATFISSGTSLLDSLTAILQSSLGSVDGDHILYAPMRLASKSMEIVLKVCRNPSTSRIMLDHFATQQFFEKLIELDPQAHEQTLWDGKLFDTKLDSNWKVFVQCESNGALLSYLRYKSELLQYLSLALHRLASTGGKSHIKSQIDLLISNRLCSARIFSFLDILSYGNVPTDYETLKDLSLFKNIPINLETVTLRNDCKGNIYDFSAINSLMEVTQRARLTTGHNTASDPNYLSLSERVTHESRVIFKTITEFLSRKTYMDNQLSILHSWVQLVEIVISDGQLAPLERSNFILEVFSSIVPKINDYIELNISFSEELVSLAVVLFDVYQKDRNEIDRFQSVDSRLYNLFKACIHGINSPLTTLSIRSDFYVLANSYLVRILNDEKLARPVLQDFKMNSEVLVDVICSDSVYGQGTNRITGIFLMDSLIRLGDLNKENFILSSLTKNTYLLLIIRSIKNTDDLFSSPSENISIDDLLYELTAFKSIVYLLIRIAENRNGAQALIQNKLFKVIGNCSFLKLDPDLGLELFFDEMTVKNSSLLSVNVSLDKPLYFGKDANGVSLFEIVVPVFQLISAVLLSMGSANLTVIREVKELLAKFRKLSLGIMKRDALKDTNEKYHLSGSSADGLQQMVKLIVMLCTLTGYNGEEKIQQTF